MIKGIRFLQRLNSFFSKIIFFLSTFFIVNDFAGFYKKARATKRFPVRIRDLYPCAFDKTPTTEFNRHYVYHTAWAARVVAETKPDIHIDISSAIDFCSLVSAFVPVQFYDYRPLNIKLSNLTCGRADLVNLPFRSGSIRSLSCMHTVEHVGLGRYGDSIDPDGDLKAMRELQRVLVPGGNLLFVVPIGKPRLRFNAHRVYSYDQIVESFHSLHLKEFSLVSERKESLGMTRNATKVQADNEDFGCGCFWFTKHQGGNV